MQQVPLDIKINPSDLDEIESWRKELLWRPMNKDDIVEFIRTKIRSHPEVKSGVVLYRDFALDSFQQISFSQRSIVQPEPADAYVKLKKATQARKPKTFEEKADLLGKFVIATGRFPNADDKFPEGPNLYKFFLSVQKSKDKYDGLINDCKSNSRNESGSEATTSGTDDGSDGRGGRVLLGRRGGDDGLEEESIDEAPRKKKPARK